MSPEKSLKEKPVVVKSQSNIEFLNSTKIWASDFSNNHKESSETSGGIPNYI